MPAAAALLLPAPMRSDPAPNAARLAPAVAENVGGRKKRRIKAGGRLRRLRPVTPPRSAGRDNGLREVQQVAGNGVKNGRVISLLRSISPKPYCHKEKTGVRAGIARVFQRDGPRYAPTSPQELRCLKQ